MATDYYQLTTPVGSWLSGPVWQQNYPEGYLALFDAIAPRQRPDGSWEFQSAVEFLGMFHRIFPYAKKHSVTCSGFPGVSDAFGSSNVQACCPDRARRNPQASD